MTVLNSDYQHQLLFISDITEVESDIMLYTKQIHFYTIDKSVTSIPMCIGRTSDREKWCIQSHMIVQANEACFGQKHRVWWVNY